MGTHMGPQISTHMGTYMGTYMGNHMGTHMGTRWSLIYIEPCMDPLYVSGIKITNATALEMFIIHRWM